MTTALRPERSRTFIAVRTAAVPVCADFRVSIYLWNAGTRHYDLYRNADTQVATSDLKRLCSAGISTVYLHSGEYGRFQEHLRTVLHSIVVNETLPVSQRFGVLNEVVRDVLRETFRFGDVSRAVDKAGELANHMVELVCRDDFAATELGSVLHFDYGTFTHSANVAYYSVLLAQALGQKDRNVLKQIGTGALLHDIGKIEIPDQIINKRGRLSNDEYETVRRHASLGLLNLRRQDRLDFGQLMMAYQHHERLDGSGYPVRLEGSEIHEWARICAVADVFEALTSQRPYRRRLSTGAALDFIQRTAARGLDPELLRCLKSTIGKS